VSSPARSSSRDRTLEEAAGALPSRRTVGGGRRRQIVAILLVALLLSGAGAYVALERPSSGGGGPPSISVALGAPVSGTVACGDGKNMVTERVPWAGATGPVTTGQFTLEIQEIADGDVIGTDNPPGAVTPSNLCQGNAETYVFDWYVVLQGSNGTNEATFTYANGWQSVPPAVLPIELGTNSTLVLVAGSSFVGLGYALEVLPSGNGVPVNGSTAI